MVKTLEKFYTFPKAAFVDKKIAKVKIYEHGHVTSGLKDLFVQQVEKIVWSYKLSSATINLAATDQVQEIQVFSIFLKTGEVSEKVLEAIDRAIPSPILFELRYGDKVKCTATYKRRSDADVSKWVLGAYFGTQWQTETEIKREELPLLLDMGRLYQYIMENLLPVASREEETFPSLLARVEERKALLYGAEKLESKIKKTKQFNKRIELNNKLNKLRKKIEIL